MAGKKMKLSHDKSPNLHCDDCIHDHFDISNNGGNLWLCKLPIELLDFIFSFLSPQDIVNIQKLDVQRLTEASLGYNSEKANFILCNTVSPADLTLFFSRDRVQHIREINFDNLFFVKASILHNCIVKCKCLKKLSVLECNLSYLNVLSVLKNCTKLEALFWNVPTKFLSGCEYPPISYHVTVKKLYLSVKALDDKELYLVSDLIVRCSSAKDICLFFIRQFAESLPPAGRFIWVRENNHVEGRAIKMVLKRHLYNTPLTYRGALRPYEMMTMMADPLAIYTQLRECRKRPDWLLIASKVDIVSFPFTNQSLAYVQHIMCKEPLAFPCLPDNSVHSLVLILQGSEDSIEEVRNPRWLLNQMKDITKMIGSNLKSLTFNEDTFLNLKPVVLTTITTKCNKIKILNLSNLHFPEPFDFSALYCLEDLEELMLSSCTFRDSNDYHSNAYDLHFATQSSFNEVVAACKKVEKFSLYGCVGCICGPIETALDPIHEWKKLRSLTLIGILNFRTCHFLLRVASCPQLTSLEITNVGQPSVCHYIPNLVHVMKKSTQLKFLRINQDGFPPAHSLFWKSIESAKNLQGICLATSLSTHVDNKLITEAIKNLPFLHLFHLSAKQYCRNLSTQIKQIMKENGVQVCTVEISDRADEPIQFYPFQDEECRHCQLYVI